MGIFSSSVQYDDLKGTSAADRSDSIDPTTWLRNKGHINDEKHVVGMNVYIGEQYDQLRKIMVTFLVSGLRGFANIPELLQNIDEPIKLEAIHVDMDCSVFFSLFKRFNITLSNNGLLEGKNYLED